uniref:DUF2971 domain-containing protein n=1 Tax=Pseudomonas sp. GTC 16482 TaxID=1661693 RepID=UPI0009E81C41
MHLFKYLRPERVDVLEARVLAYSKPSRFNDPFDCLPSFIDSNELNPVGARKYFVQARPQDLHLPHLKEAFLDHVRRSIAADPSFTLSSISLIDPDPNGHYIEHARGYRAALESHLQDSVVALSLSEEVNSLLMWAHYAADHTGFVVGFDAGHTFFNTVAVNSYGPGSLNKIVYSECRPSGIAGAMSVESAYLTKGIEWGYEKEWRILQKANNASSVIETPIGDVHLFEFPSDAVTAVVIGARATESTRSRIESVLR